MFYVGKRSLQQDNQNTMVVLSYPFSCRYMTSTMEDNREVRQRKERILGSTGVLAASEKNDFIIMPQNAQTMVSMVLWRASVVRVVRGIQYFAAFQYCSLSSTLVRGMTFEAKEYVGHSH